MANKKRTREKWRERAWATPRAKRKVKRGMGEGERGGGHRSFVMLKEHRFSGSRCRVFDIEMGRNSPPSPRLCRCRPLFISMRSTWYQTRRHSHEGGGGRWGRRGCSSSYFVDASAVSCSGGFPNRVAMRAVRLFSLSLGLSPRPARVRPRVSSVHVIHHGRFPRVIYYRLAIPLRE